MASLSVSEWCIRFIERLTSDLAHYNDRRSVHHSALVAYQLNLSCVKWLQPKGSSYISVAVDLALFDIPRISAILELKIVKMIVDFKEY